MFNPSAELFSRTCSWKGQRQAWLRVNVGLAGVPKGAGVLQVPDGVWRRWGGGKVEEQITAGAMVPL